MPRESRSVRRSQAQACLLVVGYICFRCCQSRGAPAAAARAAEKRRDATRKMRSREKQRVQQEVEQQMQQHVQQEARRRRQVG